MGQHIPLPKFCWFLKLAYTYQNFSPQTSLKEKVVKFHQMSYSYNDRGIQKTAKIANKISRIKSMKNKPLDYGLNYPKWIISSLSRHLLCDLNSSSLAWKLFLSSLSPLEVNQKLNFQTTISTSYIQRVCGKCTKIQLDYWELFLIFLESKKNFQSNWV